MEIISLTLGNYQMSSNCYILVKDANAIVIDPGFDDPKLFNYLKNKELEVTDIVLTHGHFDHWGGLKKLQEQYPKALLHASSSDYIWYEVGKNNLYGYTPKIDNDLSKLDKLKLLNTDMKVIKIPGHSQGSIGLYFDKKLFSGDVLFFQGIGRYDLEQGDYNTLINSLKNIYQYSNDTIIYSGHGRPTTVLNEKQNNPFLKG